MVEMVHHGHRVLHRFDFLCITCFWQFRRDLIPTVNRPSYLNAQGCDFLVCRVWLDGDNDQSLSLQWFVHFSDRRLKVFAVSEEKVVMGAFGDGNFSSSKAALTSLLSAFVESQVKSSQVAQPTCWWKWVGDRGPCRGEIQSPDWFFINFPTNWPKSHVPWILSAKVGWLCGIKGHFLQLFDPNLWFLEW